MKKKLASVDMIKEYKPSSKITALLKKLSEVDKNDKCLVFSQVKLKYLSILISQSGWTCLT